MVEFGGTQKDLFVMTDGYHEVHGWLTESCKQDIINKYPSK